MTVKKAHFVLKMKRKYANLAIAILATPLQHCSVPYDGFFVVDVVVLFYYLLDQGWANYGRGPHTARCVV